MSVAWVLAFFGKIESNDGPVNTRGMIPFLVLASAAWVGALCMAYGFFDAPDFRSVAVPLKAWVIESFPEAEENLITILIASFAGTFIWTFGYHFIVRLKKPGKVATMVSLSLVMTVFISGGLLALLKISL